MTRGRPPLVALKEAHRIAMKRGQVLPVSEGRCDHFHFIHFTETRTIFVKVKRMLSDISDPTDIISSYDREIRRLSRVPLNSVDAREFWVRSPRGKFHFFLVGKDGIFGLQEDGSLMTGIKYPREEPVRKESPAQPAGKIPAADSKNDLLAEKDPAAAQPPAVPETQKDPAPEQVPAEG